MSYNDIRVALYTHINTNFSAAQIAFKGDDQRAEALDKGSDPWIYIYIRWGDEIQKSMGSPNAQFLQLGILAAKLYVSKADGEGVLDTVSDSYKAITRCKQVGNITLEPMESGPTEETEKWQVRHLYSPFKAVNTYSILPV